MGKEQTVPCSVHDFSGSSPGFFVFHSVSFKGAHRKLQSLLGVGRTGVHFDLCLLLLKLMASTILVVRLGRLHMRDLQFWVSTHGLDHQTTLLAWASKKR